MRTYALVWLVGTVLVSSTTNRTATATAPLHCGMLRLSGVHARERESARAGERERSSKTLRQRRSEGATSETEH